MVNSLARTKIHYFIRNSKFLSKIDYPKWIKFEKWESYWVEGPVIMDFRAYKIATTAMEQPPYFTGKLKKVVG